MNRTKAHDTKQVLMQLLSCCLILYRNCLLIKCNEIETISLFLIRSGIECVCVCEREREIKKKVFL